MKLVCIQHATQLDRIESSTTYVIGKTQSGSPRIIHVMSKWVCPHCGWLIAFTNEKPLAILGDPGFHSLVAIAAGRENTIYYTFGGKTP